MIIIPGFTPSDKVPGVVAKNEFGAGRQSIGAIPLVCVLFGNKTSGGSAPLDERTFVSTPEECDAAAGARSELGRMGHAALEIPGVTVELVAVEEAAGAVSATYILDIGGSWSASGELGLQLDEEVIRVSVAASHTPTTFGDALVDAVNQAQNGRLFCVAANNAGRVTMTVSSAGVRGNQHSAFVTTSLLPSGMTVVPDQFSDIVKSDAGPVITVDGSDTADHTYVITISTGGANDGTAQYTLTVDGGTPSAPAALPSGDFALPSHTGIMVTAPAGTYVLNETYTWSGVAALSNGAVPFSLGTGSDSIQDALDGTESETNDYIGLAHNDVTNVGLVEVASNAKAAFDVSRLENYVTSTNRTLTTAIALGQVGMNDQLGHCAWVQNGTEHPSRVSARLAALFSVTEGAQPNTNYDDVVLPGAAAQLKKSDVPNRSTLNSALNNGVAPLISIGGDLVIVRAINSRCLNGSTPDYRTYDRGDTIVPIRVRKELVAYGQQIKTENPYDGPDAEEGLPPPGTFTPRLWNGFAEAKLREWETERFNWITDVDNNLPESEWDSAGKRVMSVIPTVVKHQFHQLGIIVRQTAA